MDYDDGHHDEYDDSDDKPCAYHHRCLANGRLLPKDPAKDPECCPIENGDHKMRTNLYCILRDQLLQKVGDGMLASPAPENGDEEETTWS